MNYLPIVGMEIHVELKTASKMFCGCKNDPFAAPKPNIYTCPVCLGMPGALPLPNKKAIEWTLLLGMALGCEISLHSKFDRKNYFYPDLPKGYQISQYDQPFARHGELKFKVQNEKSKIDEEKIVRINRVHLEEDTGKLLHGDVDGKAVSLIDYNRSGVPLVEIVTEPDIHSSEEARAFLKKLHHIIRFLDISDAEMEKGSMRLEPNISVAVIPSANEGSPANAGSRQDAIASLQHDEITLPPYKVEVKNINSFNFVKKAIDFEVARHIEILETGSYPTQETRGWNEKKNITYSQRTKEEAQDYRYFPDPDIPPIEFTQMQLDELRKSLPELPDAKVARFVASYSLPQQDALRLIETKELAQYFEDSVKRSASSEVSKPIQAKDIANWILNKKIDIEKVSIEELLQQISAKAVKVTVDPQELQKVIEKIISENQKAVEDYKNGKVGIIMFLVGQAMKELKGKGDAQVIKGMLEERLLL